MANTDVQIGDFLVIRNKWNHTTNVGDICKISRDGASVDSSYRGFWEVDYSLFRHNIEKGESWCLKKDPQFYRLANNQEIQERGYLGEENPHG